jgi:ferrochelatase
MKHAPPFIEEAVADAKILGVKRLIGLPLAPHYARMSFGGYEKALREAWSGPILLISGFHTHPSFIRAVRAVLEEALANFSPQHVFFTAHSLPARIVREGDDYPGRVLESCRLVAEGIELPPWDVAFQSASASGEPWLGPDLLDALETSGARAALICPIGFVADHLEILYDVDVQAASWAWERGIDLRRTRSFNADPVFIAALADVVKDAVAQNALVAP